jgi:2-phosphosulfolactate phosphatase
MRIETADFVAGARDAHGVIVVIDVFRAFSTACYAIAGGVSKLIPMASADEALALKHRNPDWLAAGERHARRLPGFDFGNSPTEIANADLRNRTLVHSTHAGTQGLVNAAQADVVLTGSLVNAAAICTYIRKLAPPLVSLLRMGHEARERCAEDDLCADLLAARLKGDAFDVSDVRERLRDAPAAAKFFDPAADWAPEMDFNLCTAIDHFDFVLRLTGRDTPLPYLEKINV